jgi:hypothetical protein
MVKSDDKTISATMTSICHVVVIIGAAVDDDMVVIITTTTRRAHSLPGFHITFYYGMYFQLPKQKGALAVLIQHCGTAQYSIYKESSWQAPEQADIVITQQV